ncbi:MAG: 8-oxo-dGTP diphosphatase [Armatimonadetes bacterium]|nr:8-oxo-dGTP diphosphatase [Armatimonadota bacterium]
MPAINLRTLCFIRDGDRVLLIHRTKPPNADLYNAIGGKVEPGEDPHDACLREVREETGLRLERIRLRALVTILVETTGDRWVLFVYAADRPPGAEVKGSDEGPLLWAPVEAVPTYRVPADIPLLLPHVFADDPRILHARLTYQTPDAATMVASRIEYA